MNRGREAKTGVPEPSQFCLCNDFEVGQLQRGGGPCTPQGAQTDKAQVLPQQTGRQSLESFVVHMASRHLPLEVLGGGWKGVRESDGQSMSVHMCAHVSMSVGPCV